MFIFIRFSIYYFAYFVRFSITIWVILSVFPIFQHFPLYVIRTLLNQLLQCPYNNIFWSIVFLRYLIIYLTVITKGWCIIERKINTKIAQNITCSKETTCTRRKMRHCLMENLGPVLNAQIMNDMKLRTQFMDCAHILHYRREKRHGQKRVLHLLK